MDESIGALRVSQLDSSTLDNELETILGAQLRRALECIPGYDFSWLEPELEAVVKSLFWYFVFRNEGASLGQQMMDMSYRQSAANRIPSIHTKWAYYLCTVILPWIRQRLPSIIGLNDDERKFRVETVLERCGSVFELIDLLHFVWFLNRGGFRTLLERLLGLRAVHNTHPELDTVDTEFTERELLWHGFSDILIFFIPLLNYRRFYNAVLRTRKRLRQFWSNDEQTVREVGVEKRIKKLDLLSACGYCRQVPPILPCHLGCAHVYCYYCLSSNLEADKNFACLICGSVNSDGRVIFIIGSMID